MPDVLSERPPRIPLFDGLPNDLLSARRMVQPIDVARRVTRLPVVLPPARRDPERNACHNDVSTAVRL